VHHILASSAQFRCAFNTGFDTVNLYRLTPAEVAAPASTGGDVALEEGVSGAATVAQGLALVHFSAQRERSLWDRGYIMRLFRGCLRDVSGYEGMLRVYFVSEMAQVELKSG
jgi:hypothetical protein